MLARADPDQDERKNQQKKRNPRRIFSFDSIKSNNSSRRSLSECEATKVNLRSPFELSNVQEGDNETNSVAGGHVTAVQEPISDINSITSSPADRARSSTRLEPVRPTSIPPRSSTPDTPRSVPSTTTKARWENLRQHVLPGPLRPLSPQQKPTTPSVSLFNPPLRSSTPKSSGFSRLGFRQVVEHVQEVVDTRRFGKEILKACAAARYAEASRSTKDRDGQLSAISLSGTVTSASTTTTGRKMDCFPQSIASLASASSGSTISPSLKPLYQLLVYHSRPSAETDQRIPVHLPHESHVLGTLLCPFLTPSKYPFIKGEEEKATAVEAFELILRIWTPVDEVSLLPKYHENNVNGYASSRQV